MIKLSKIAHLTGHNGAIYCLAHYKGNRFFSAGYDNMIVEWDIDNPEQANSIAKLPSKAISLLYIEEKNWLVVGQTTGGVHIIDLTIKREINLLQAHTDMIFALCYNPSNNNLYVGGGDGAVSVWDLDSMTALKIKKISEGKVREIKLYNDLLFIGLTEGSVLVSSLELNKIDEVKEHLENFSVNTIFVDEERILSGSRDGHLNELTVNGSTYQLKNRIPAHNYAIYKIVKAPNEMYFATASRDKSIKIWDANNLKFIFKIDFMSHKSHIASVNDLIWFDKYLISASDDRSIIVWNIEC